jgi:hypothetical protein
MRIFRVSFLPFAALSAFGDPGSGRADSRGITRIPGVHLRSARVLLSICGNGTAGFPTSLEVNTK